jgi:DNA-binding FadR family transcriptional regulator
MSAHREVIVAELDLDDLPDLGTTRRELEVFAAALAATNATERDLAEIAEALKAKAPRGGERSDAWKANRTLHERIYKASHNSVLIELLGTLWERYDRYWEIFTRDIVFFDRTASSEHKAIVQAIIQRKPKQAMAAMRQHHSKADGLVRKS